MIEYYRSGPMKVDGQEYRGDLKILRNRVKENRCEEKRDFLQLHLLSSLHRVDIRSSCLQHRVYDSVETLKLLDGIFDIYVPDFKYARIDVAEKYLQAPDDPQQPAKSILQESL